MTQRPDLDEWVSWAEAAEIAGVPIHTIEWWKRQGRIEHRPEDKRRPTLRRRSVEDFARWYRNRESQRRRVREDDARRRGEAGPPDPVGWLSSVDAAARLGVQPRTVARFARRLGAVKRDRRWWFPEATVQQLRADRDARLQRAEGRQWVSQETAAEIIGCHPSTVATYVERGLIDRRRVGPRKPTLDLTSVMAFAERWKAAAPEVHSGSRRHVRALGG